MTKRSQNLLDQVREATTYSDDPSTGPPHLDAEGYLTIPDGPGLGVTLDPDKVARYSRGQVTVFK